MPPLPLITDTPLRSRPWMNWLLIAANIGAFLWQRLHPQAMARCELAVQSLDLYRFVTYAFMHVGWSHLILNMLMLYVLGNNINDRLGQLGYLGFYLAGAVVSAIGYVLLGGVAVVGASGAVGAVMGAFLVLLPTSNITVYGIVAWLEVPSMYFVVVFFVYNVVMSLLSRLGAPTVAYEAHIAGMLFGFVIALVLLLGRLLPRQGSDLLALLRQARRNGRAELSDKA